MDWLKNRSAVAALLLTLALLVNPGVSGEPADISRPATTTISIAILIDAADPALAGVVRAVLNDSLSRDGNYTPTEIRRFAVLTLHLHHRAGERAGLLDVSLSTVTGERIELVTGIQLDPERPRVVWDDVVDRLVRSLSGLALPVRDDRGLPAWLYRMQYFYDPAELAEALQNEEGLPAEIDEELQRAILAARKARNRAELSGPVAFAGTMLTIGGAFAIYGALNPQMPDSERPAFALGGTAALLIGIPGIVAGGWLMSGPGYPEFDEFAKNYNGWYIEQCVEPALDSGQ